MNPTSSGVLTVAALVGLALLACNNGGVQGSEEAGAPSSGSTCGVGGPAAVAALDAFPAPTTPDGTDAGPASPITGTATFATTGVGVDLDGLDHGLRRRRRIPGGHPPGRDVRERGTAGARLGPTSRRRHCRSDVHGQQRPRTSLLLATEYGRETMERRRSVIVRRSGSRPRDPRPGFDAAACMRHDRRGSGRRGLARGVFVRRGRPPGGRHPCPARRPLRVRGDLSRWTVSRSPEAVGLRVYALRSVRVPRPVLGLRDLPRGGEGRRMRQLVRDGSRVRGVHERPDGVRARLLSGRGVVRRSDARRALQQGRGVLRDARGPSPAVSRGSPEAREAGRRRDLHRDDVRPGLLDPRGVRPALQFRPMTRAGAFRGRRGRPRTFRKAWARRRFTSTGTRVMERGWSKRKRPGRLAGSSRR